MIWIIWYLSECGLCLCMCARVCVCVCVRAQSCQSWGRLPTEGEQSKCVNNVHQLPAQSAQFKSYTAQCSCSLQPLTPAGFHIWTALLNCRPNWVKSIGPVDLVKTKSSCFMRYIIGWQQKTLQDVSGKSAKRSLTKHLIWGLGEQKLRKLLSFTPLHYRNRLN